MRGGEEVWGGEVRRCGGGGGEKVWGGEEVWGGGVRGEGCEW